MARDDGQVVAHHAGHAGGRAYVGERFTGRALRVRVHGARRLIEREQGRLAHQGAGDEDALFLAFAQLVVARPRGESGRFPSRATAARSVAGAKSSSLGPRHLDNIEHAAGDPSVNVPPLRDVGDPRRHCDPPPTGGISSSRVRMSVVFPQPFGPTSAQCSPARISSEIGGKSATFW